MFIQLFAEEIFIMQRVVTKCFLLLMKSHLQSYPCPLHLNSFWNLGFLLGVSIIIQIITGIFLGLHYTSLPILQVFHF